MQYLAPYSSSGVIKVSRKPKIPIFKKDIIYTIDLQLNLFGLFRSSDGVTQLCLAVKLQKCGGLPNFTLLFITEFWVNFSFK